MAVTVEISNVQGIRDLLSILEAETEIILTEADMPVVTLSITHHLKIPKEGRVPDSLPQIWISEDFDAELPEKYWVNRKL